MLALRPGTLLPLLGAISLVCVLVAALSAAPWAHGGLPLTVNSLADNDDGACDSSPGDCTLREAINAANADVAADTIGFDIGSGTPTINVGAAGLPTITQPVTINGNTGGATRIELNGTGTNAGVDGLRVTGGGTTIRALVINRFAGDGVELLGPNGGNKIEGSFIGTNAAGTAAQGNNSELLTYGVNVKDSPNNVIGGTAAGAGNVISGSNMGFAELQIHMSGATGNLVQGNFIGTDVTGTFGLSPFSNGVIVTGASGNTIGGATAAARNIVSGAFHGVQIGGNGNFVQGNFIGTDVTGMLALGNTGFGIVVSQGQNNTIGGTAGTTPGGSCTGACNLISGNNGLYGILIQYTQSTANMVQGNFIGTNVTGTAAIPNNTDGIAIDGALNNTIGGTTTAARNLISGNGSRGVRIRGFAGPNATGNQVQGNFIGTDTTGTAPIPNGSFGVWLDNDIGVVSNNTIGGTAAGAGNTIAFNNHVGVFAPLSGTGNAILGNSIFSNVGVGIQLGMAGPPLPNDAGDGDSGPNNLQNYPDIASVASGSTTIKGTLDSTADTQFRLEFFSNPACDTDYSGTHGEGKVFIGFTNVTTDGNGDASYDVTFPATVPAGQVITSTATDPNGNTSEFSECVTVTLGATPTPSLTPTPFGQTATPTATPTVPATLTPTPTLTFCDVLPPATPAPGCLGTPTPMRTPVPSGQTPGPTPTVTPTPTAGPSGTPVGKLTQGDVQCDGDVDTVDALQELRDVAALPTFQQPDCPDIGAEVASLFGDVDCDNDVDSVDALKVLRHVAALPVGQTEPCEDIGAALD